jgi:hypothetical protein
VQSLVPDLLWTEAEPLRVLGLPLGRRVTVVRGDSGRLVVFSPLRPTEANFAALRSLGDVGVFVVTNLVHDLWFDGWFGAFPEARFVADDVVRAGHPGWPLTRLEAGDPTLAGLEFRLLDGMPRVRETVFLHRATRTLVVTDALFNLTVPARGPGRWLLAAAGMAHPPGPSRLFRWAIRSRARFEASVRGVLGWDFDRIMVGHGGVVEREGREVWARAFAYRTERRGRLHERGGFVT